MPVVEIFHANPLHPLDSLIKPNLSTFKPCHSLPIVPFLQSKRDRPPPFDWTKVDPIRNAFPDDYLWNIILVRLHIHIIQVSCESHYCSKVWLT